MPICLGNVTSSSSVGQPEGTGIEFPRVAVQHELSRNVERTAPHVVIIGLADWASIMGEIDDSIVRRRGTERVCEKRRPRFFSPNVSKVIGDFYKRWSVSTPRGA